MAGKETRYVRVLEGESDDDARQRYWREHPEDAACEVTVIRRVIVLSGGLLLRRSTLKVRRVTSRAFRHALPSCANSRSMILAKASGLDAHPPTWVVLLPCAL
jgi:hypothetical protein